MRSRRGLRAARGPRGLRSVSGDGRGERARAVARSGGGNAADRRRVTLRRKSPHPWRPLQTESPSAVRACPRGLLHHFRKVFVCQDQFACDGESMGSWDEHSSEGASEAERQWSLVRVANLLPRDACKPDTG